MSKILLKSRDKLINEININKKNVFIYINQSIHQLFDLKINLQIYL